MENKRRKKKLILLSQATSFFGYSKDNLLYLAKKGEIRIVQKDSSCFADFDSLSEYRKNHDRKFQTEFATDWRKKKQTKKVVHDVIPPVRREMQKIKGDIIESVKFMEKKVSIWTKALILFLKTSKYGSVALILFIVMFGGFFSWALSPKIETIEIYPAKFEGSWRNMENALERNLDMGADLLKFNDENSVKAGLENISNQQEQQPINSEENNIDEETKSLDSGEENKQTEEVQGAEIIIPLDDSTNQEGADIIVPEIDTDDVGIEIEKNIESENIDNSGGENNFEKAESEPEIFPPSDANEVQEELVPTNEVSKFDFLNLNKNLLSVNMANAQEIEDNLIIDTNNITDETVQVEDENVNFDSDSFENSEGIILPEIEINLSSDIESNIEQINEDWTVAKNKSEVIFSDFKIPEKSEEIKKVKIGLSFASEGKDGEIAKVFADFSLDGENWNNAFVFNKDQIYSNKENGGYFYFNIFDLQNENLSDEILLWQDLKKLKVRFIAPSDDLFQPPTFIDAVWIEVKYEKLSEPEGDADTRLIKDFNIKKDQELRFQYKKDNSGLLVFLGEKLGIIDAEENIKTTVKIIDPEGKEAETIHEVFFDSDETVTLRIKKPPKFRPGVYKASLNIDDDGKVATFERSFQWGVLAINTNKSIYTLSSMNESVEQSGNVGSNSCSEGVNPCESVYLQMAALDANGHTVCDANLSLEIQDPSLRIIDLSTGDGTIKYSESCGTDNVTDMPDYFAYYSARETGTYQMKLVNLDNGYEITDSFEVRDLVSFEIERIGATRINPFKASYRMNLKISANDAFMGNMIETVPDSFVILDQKIVIRDASGDENQFLNVEYDEQDVGNGEKRMIWKNIFLKQGDEVEIVYEYQAPKISPEFYLLGPLEFHIGSCFSGGASCVPIFQESRSWQIASDATIQKFYFHNAASPNTGTLPGASTLSSTSPTVTATGAGTNRDMNGTIGTSQANSTLATQANTDLNSHWYRRFLSRPLAAQTLPTGVWTIRGGVAESHNSANMLVWGAVIKVWRPSTGAVVATLLDNPFLGSTEPTGTSINDISQSTGSISGVAIADGDVLVVELWSQAQQNPPGKAYNLFIYYDGTTEGSTTSNAAYLNAPGAITLYTTNSVSGRVCTNESCSADIGSGVAMVLKQNGTNTYTTTTTASGNYQFASVGNMSANDVFTIYVGNTAATDDNGSYNAVTVTKISVDGDLTGINLYTGRIIARYEGSITELTDSDMNAWDSGNDADVHFLAGASSLVVENTEEFHVWTGKTFRPAGTLTTTATGTSSGTGADIHIDTGATLNMQTNALSVGGDFTNSGTFSKTNPETTTFTATGSGFSINSGGSNFNNVVFDGASGAWTASTSTFTADGTLTITAGNFDTGAVTNAITGATSVTGTLTISSTTGTKTFSGDVTINSGGLWYETAAGDISFAGSLANNQTFTASTGVHTFTGTGKNISGTIAIPNLTISGTTTNNGALTVSTALSGGSTLTNSASGTLNIGGTSGITGLTATASGNTVNYNGTDQTVKSVSYHHLTLSNSGAKTMTSVTTIAGDLAISGSATMTGNAAFTLTGALNYSSNGSTTLSASTAISIGKYNQSAGAIIDNGNTITVTGTGASVWTKSAGTFTATGTAIFTGTAPQIGASNFNNLTINVGGGNTATLTGAASVAGNLSVSTGTLDIGSYTANRGSAGGTLTVSSGAKLKIGGTGTLPSNYSTHSIGATSTVEYAGTTTSVASLNSSQSYGNLTISGSGVTSTSDFSVAGTISVTGSLIASAGTVSMNNSSDISNSGTLTFYNLTVPDGASITGSGNFAVDGTFTVGPTATATFTPSAADVISGASGTLTGYGTVKVTRISATADFSSQYTIAVKTLTNLTVEYVGTENQTVSALSDYGHLKINLTSGKVATLAGGITVNGNLNITSGTLDAGSGLNYPIAVKGNWTKAGTFLAQQGTVTFSGGTQTINSDNTWFGLAITGSIARIVSFESGKTQTISANGALTLTGASGQLLTLAPLTPASSWLLNINATGVTQSISYVSVSYSNAGAGAAVEAYNNPNTDGGNNQNWKFYNISVSIDSDAVNITLLESTTKNVVCASTITYGSGFGAITSVEAKFFRTGIGAGAGDDDNNHYTLAGDTECFPSNGAGLTEDYTCIFAVWFFAEPTDAGSPDSGDNWTCQVTPSSAGGPGNFAVDTIEMDTLSALSIEDLDYGGVGAGMNTGSSPVSVVVTNTGNNIMDPQVSSATAMTCTTGSIPVANQKYSSSTFTYSSGGTVLSGAATTLDLALPKPTSTTPITANSYWGIAIPSSGAVGSCTGINIFGPVPGS